MRKVKKVGLVANLTKEKALSCTSDLASWLESRGIEVLWEKTLAKKEKKDGLELSKLSSSVDLLIVLGGDGTILRTACFAARSQTPIVGINLGDFGYLTEVNLGEVYSALEIILAGGGKQSKRMMLEALVNIDEGIRGGFTALNDVVLNRADSQKMIELETYIDDHYLITYRADGLIISTPTGSTAYSLSAGGPIVFPNQDVIIINPICPHTLTNRPIIVPPTVTVKVILRSPKQGAILSLDGQAVLTLREGNILTVKRAETATILISSPHRDYMEILRSKLGWGSLKMNQCKRKD